MFSLEHPDVGVDPSFERLPRLLLIDGDAGFRAELSLALSRAGNEVECAGTGLAGVALARSSRPDIVVFDLRQPDVDGLVLCRLLCDESMPRRPSLCVLTAANDEADRVAAFEAGVDDYVTKPHSTRELILRVRSLARRRSSPPPADEEQALRVGALTIDGAARRVDVAGSAVELTRREFDLLYFLVQRPDRVQSRDTLVTHVWADVADSGRVVDTTVKRLRKKLGPASPPIKTVRGIGYKLGLDAPPKAGGAPLRGIADVDAPPKAGGAPLRGIADVE